MTTDDARLWAHRLFPTAVWTLALAAFLSGWGLTQRFPALLLWTLVWLAVYLTLAALQTSTDARVWNRGVRVRAMMWGVAIALTAIAYVFLPGVRLRGELVPTAVVTDLLDVALPVWIAAAAVPLLTKSRLLQAIVLVAVPAIVIAGLLRYMTAMPGRSYAGRLAPLDSDQEIMRDRLMEHVRVLATDIGVRNASRYPALERAAAYVRATFEQMGYNVNEQIFELGHQPFRNLEVEVVGSERPEEIVVIGAHYDTAELTPGANDDASGVAALLELARMFRGSQPHRTLRFVAFPNEEPPFFHSEDMGSWRYAAAARERNDRIVAMISLETIAFYSDEPGSQQYPPILGWLYPNRGDFIGFVGNLTSRSLVHRAIRVFRASTAFPSEGVASPEQVPGITWSDHLCFWMHGYKAIMVTDTAPFRYAHYHQPSDTPEKLDYDAMTRVVGGIETVVADLVGAGG